MTTINVSLTPQLDDYIRAKVATGDFASASEVVRAGLRGMRQAEERLEELRVLIREADESGPAVPADEVFDRLSAKYKAMAKQRED